MRKTTPDADSPARPAATTSTRARAGRGPANRPGAGIEPQVEPDIRLLTVEQLAVTLGCNISWIYDEVEAGTFPVVRLGRRLRFRPTDIHTYLTAHTSPTQPPPPTRNGNPADRLNAHLKPAGPTPKR